MVLYAIVAVIHELHTYSLLAKYVVAIDTAQAIARSSLKFSNQFFLSMLLLG